MCRACEVCTPQSTAPRAWPTRRPTRSIVALKRAWRAARRAVAGRRRHSRAAAAVDLLAAAPLLPATSLAAGLGMALKNATLLLDDFCATGIAIEVTHRSKCRLFGLTGLIGLAPLRDVVRPPYRPKPGRGRGCDHRAGAAARAAARLPAVRLQRPRPLDDTDRPDHPSGAAHLGALAYPDSSPSQPTDSNHAGQIGGLGP